MEDIQRLDIDNMPIPFAKNNDEMAILRKTLKFPKIETVQNAKIFQGEVNLTVFKDCLKDSGGANLVRGDQIKRYGLVTASGLKLSFLDAERFMTKIGTTEKATHHKHPINYPS